MAHTAVLADVTVDKVRKNYETPFGFIVPEYSVSHKATRKMDVFAFGVLVLEFVTHRRALCKFQEAF
uniref:Serine-threonine/tyrosine-protein kinase catalytic domain-containing protein n=1 Tax=Oryza meridionalis TaxID=40149 RepID=A0A0E0D1B1_9ORYZ